jgi:hypothetical protein
MGIDLLWLQQCQDLGYIPSEASLDLFPTSEVQVWRDVVESDRPGENRSVIDDDDTDMADLIGMLAEDIEVTIGWTLAECSPEPARDFAARVAETDLLVALEEDPSDGGYESLGATVAFLVLVVWLADVRSALSSVDFADEVLRSVRAELGPECASLAQNAAGVLKCAGTPRPSMQELREDLGDDVLPALIWLASGAVHRYGKGEVAWLRQHLEGHRENTTTW